MKTIIVGSGAGGGTAALELTLNGHDVTILEAGKPFKPFTRHLTLTEPIRRLGLLGDERTIKRIFPYMNAFRSDENLILVRGITTGGSTVISCGNMVRADKGLKEIGLDLTPEFEELEGRIDIKPIPLKRWRPLTRKMYDSAEILGLNPHPTPKAVKLHKCSSCGLCEMGCSTGARWDSTQFLDEALKLGAVLHTSSPVEKVLIENNRVTGVIVRSGSSTSIVKGDVVVLAAGGVGTAQILKASGLNAEDKLWVDIVLTLGGIFKDSKQLNEPPMVWYAEKEDFILSPYLDILSHFFHKPWRNVSLNDRVGIMVKLADMENGTVFSDGNVEKKVTDADENKIENAVSHAKEIMELSGVSGPFVKGMYNGGHLGGTIPLKKEDVSSMKPAGLPEGLWIADLSLAPRSQGLPTIMLTSALAMKVSRHIIE
ncbi:MAG: GMC family oxidoreductase N-terminal domain-containing protein [Methanobacterium sp.]